MTYLCLCTGARGLSETTKNVICWHLDFNTEIENIQFTWNGCLQFYFISSYKFVRFYLCRLCSKLNLWSILIWHRLRGSRRELWKYFLVRHWMSMMPTPRILWPHTSSYRVSQHRLTDVCVGPLSVQLHLTFNLHYMPWWAYRNK